MINELAKGERILRDYIELTCGVANEFLQENSCSTATEALLNCKKGFKIEILSFF